MNRGSALNIASIFGNGMKGGGFRLGDGEYLEGSEDTGLIGADRDFTIIYRVRVDDFSILTNLFNMGSDSGDTLFNQIDSGGRFRFSLLVGGDNPIRYISTSNILKSYSGEFVNILMQYMGSDYTKFEFWVDGRNLTPSSSVFTSDMVYGGTIGTSRVTIGSLFNNATQQAYTFGFVAIYDRTLNLREKRESISRIPEGYSFLLSANEPAGGSLAERLSGSVYPCIGIPASSGLAGSGTWIETLSSLPPIMQAVRILNAQSLNRSVNNCISIGFTVKIDSAITNISEIVAGLGTLSGFMLNGLEYDSEADLVTALNAVDWAHIDLIMSSITGSIGFAHTGVDYYLARHYYLSEAITLVEHRRNFGNGFFQNPILDQQFRYQHYFQCMEGSFIDNAGSGENWDLLENGNATGSGWADLATLRAACTDLGRLR